MTKVPEWSPYRGRAVLSDKDAKHQIGGPWNEVSRRYVDSEPEKWRKRAENVKQGSLDEAVKDLQEPHEWSIKELIDLNHNESLCLYKVKPAWSSLSR